MAIKPCRECKKDVSTEAAVCPHCGVPKPTEVKASAKEVRIGIGVLVGLVVGAVTMCTDGDEDRAAAAKAQAETEAECSTDLQCIGDKLTASAAIRCVAPVERLAKHSVKWTDGTFDLKFSRFRWGPEKQSVTMIGDKAQFQNGFGAFTNMVYECDLSLDGEKVLDVRAREGRI